MYIFTQNIVFGQRKIIEPSIHSFFELSNNIKDTFSSNYIDTFVIYTLSSTGCPKTISPFIAVYWLEKNIPHLRLIKETSEIKKGKLIKKVNEEVADKYFSYNLDFITQNFERIEKDTFEQRSSKIFFVQENIERLVISLGTRKTEFERELSFPKNGMDFKTIAIENFRSFILKFYIEIK